MGICVCQNLANSSPKGVHFVVCKLYLSVDFKRKIKVFPGEFCFFYILKLF